MDPLTATLIASSRPEAYPMITENGFNQALGRVLAQAHTTQRVRSVRIEVVKTAFAQASHARFDVASTHAPPYRLHVVLSYDRSYGGPVFYFQVFVPSAITPELEAMGLSDTDDEVPSTAQGHPEQVVNGNEVNGGVREGERKEKGTEEREEEGEAEEEDGEEDGGEGEEKSEREGETEVGGDHALCDTLLFDLNFVNKRIFPTSHSSFFPLSIKVHPLLGMPFYALHPCDTNEMWSALEQDPPLNPELAEERFLQWFIQVYGQTMGLELSWGAFEGHPPGHR